MCPHLSRTIGMSGQLGAGTVLHCRHDPGVGSRTGKDCPGGSTAARHNAQDATSGSYPFWKTITVQGEQRLVARLLSVQLAVLAHGPGLRMGSENLDRPGPSLRGEGPGL